jgi:hypothetical protein
MPSKKLWALISRLEHAIKKTMESSAEIAELVERIQAEGIDVSLNCIALFSDPQGRTFTGATGKIARRRKSPGARPGGRKKKEPPARAGAAPEKLELSDKDREFLRSIGIRFD